uniref:RRM domain-containing protein n=1 Tax=Caenorhabditis tropicalis TaxID=1561998 RepID=A0A1I7TQP5_9PELO
MSQENEEERMSSPRSSRSSRSNTYDDSYEQDETSETIESAEAPATIETIDPVYISVNTVQQLPAISLSGNNAQRTLWIGDVPSDWTEETLNQVFTESKHPPYKVKRVYVKDELKGYCFIEFVSFEEARQTLFDLNGVRIPGFRDLRYNLCFANDSYNPNSEFNIHVSSVPEDLSDAELYRVFDKYQSCRGAKMFRFVDGTSKGSGFVRFGNQTDQQMALVEMHRTRVGSSRIIIKLAGARGERLGDAPPYKTQRPDRRREEKSNQYRSGTSIPQQTQMYDAFGNPVVVPVDKNIYGTDHPWGPFPDDPELDPIIGLDLLTTKYRPQISNKRVMIDTDQFMLDLESSRWSSIAFKTNIKRDDLEKRLNDNPWTAIP